MKRFITLILIVMTMISAFASCAEKSVLSTSSATKSFTEPASSSKESSVEASSETVSVAVSENTITSIANSSNISTSTANSSNPPSSKNISSGWTDCSWPPPPPKSKKPSEDYSEKPANILIVGNSFVGTSQIENNFRRICYDNKVQMLQITAESIGMYEVKRFYQELDSFPLVKKGAYSIIFLCGIYDSDDMSAVRLVVDAVKNTKTKIVLFPAENENAAYIASAFKNYNCGLANWQDGIKQLYTKGFTGNNLQFDDTYLHTNELGGFFGACILYSYLYHKKPDVNLAESFVTSNYSHYLPEGNAPQLVSTMLDVAFDTVFEE